MAEKDKKTETAIVPVATQALEQTSGALEPAPDYFPVGDKRGLEDMTKADVLVPRLALAQALSPEVTEGDPNRVEGMTPGDLFNSMTKQNYGREVFVQILRKDKLRAMEFFPIDDGGGVADPDVPLDDPRLKWGEDGEKPQATVFRDYLARLLPSGELIALSFKSSGIKVAKSLNGKITWRQRPIFAGRYVITTGTELNPKPHKVFKVDNAGWVSQQDGVIGAQMFESLKDFDMAENVHHDSTTDDFDTQKMDAQTLAEAKTDM